MRLNEFQTVDINKLDDYLAKLCALVKKGQTERPDYYGMVAAGVLTPKGRWVAKLNYPKGKLRVHAERAAIEEYNKYHGEIPKGSIMITTLSPCNEKDDETAEHRVGVSCTDLINQQKFSRVYSGYTDPTQDNEHGDYKEVVTKNKQLGTMCKQFADTFLENVHQTQHLEERRKKKRPARRAAYGPGLYGGYGYYSDYGNSDGGGDGGGGESIKNEGLMGLLTTPTKVVKKPKVSSEEMRKYFEKEKAKDPDKIERGEIDRKAQQVYTKRDENFADGKNPQDKGDAKRHGINTKASVSSLRNTAKQGGRKGQLAHWLANMKAGRAKKK